MGLSADHEPFLKVCTRSAGAQPAAAAHLRAPQKIVPPVLQSFIDQDSRVRYYACEALYNIAKVARGGIIPFFNDVFDALCKLSADSDPNVQARDFGRRRGVSLFAALTVRACVVPSECGAPAGPPGQGHCDREHVVQCGGFHSAAA